MFGQSWAEPGAAPSTLARLASGVAAVAYCLSCCFIGGEVGRAVRDLGLSYFSLGSLLCLCRGRQFGCFGPKTVPLGLLLRFAFRAADLTCFRNGFACSELFLQFGIGGLRRGCEFCQESALGVGCG